MVEHPGGARFLFESGQPLVIAQRGGGEDLDRHVAAETRVLGAVHRSHPALAEHAHDPVRTEHRVFLERHGVRRVYRNRVFHSVRVSYR